MPWKVKKEQNKFCVYKEGGEKLKCYSDKKQADDYVAALYSNAETNLENLSNSMLDDGGPVIVGVAATNIPHLPLPPMGVVDINGKQMIRVPFLRKGIFRHPSGNLVFDDKTIDRMIENHQAKKSWYGVSLNLKHDADKIGAMTWFDDERGGFLRKETDPKFGDLLVGYGVPTSERALNMVKNNEYVFASAEIRPKHVNNMIAKLSMDDLDEITSEDLIESVILEDKSMDDVTISLEEYNALKERAENVTALESQIVSLEEKIVSLEKPAKKEVELPEEYKLALEKQENEIKRLKRNALVTQVELELTKAEAYRDSNGNGHSPVLLELARAAMLGDDVKTDDSNVIKLESAESADVADYFRKVFIQLLKTVPGQVRLESKTELEDKKPFGGESFNDSDFKSFWTERL